MRSVLCPQLRRLQSTRSGLSYPSALESAAIPCIESKSSSNSGCSGSKAVSQAPNILYQFCASWHGSRVSACNSNLKTPLPLEVRGFRTTGDECTATLLFSSITVQANHCAHFPCVQRSLNGLMVRYIGVRQYGIKRLSRGLPVHPRIPFKPPGQLHPQKTPSLIAQTQASTVDNLPTDLPPIQGQRKPKGRDIHVHDLEATVEAHAISNDRRARAEAGVVSRQPRPRIRRIRSLTFENLQTPLFPTPGQPREDEALGNVAEGAAHGAKPASDHPLSVGQRRGRQAVSEEDQSHGNRVGEEQRSTSLTTSSKRGTSGGFWERAVENSAPRPALRLWTRFVTHEPGISGFQRLDAEIRAFEESLKPVPREELATNQLFEEITKVIQSVLPASTITYTGARGWDVSEPLAVMNISVVSEAHAAALHKHGQYPRPEVRAIRSGDLRKLSQAFCTHPRFSPSAAMHSAEDSALDLNANEVVLLDLPTDLRIKLSCNDPSHKRNIVRFLLEETPQARPLVLILERALFVRGLLFRRAGGVDNYVLLVMVVAALRLSKTQYHRYELARQLLHVLDFWSTADMYTQGFAADPPKIFEKYRKLVKKPKSEEIRHSFEVEQSIHWEGDYDSESGSHDVGIEIISRENWAAAHGVGRYVKQDHLRHLLCLQDPAFPDQDIGKYSHRIDDIKAIFAAAHQEIKLMIDLWDMRIGRSRRPTVDVGISLLDPLVFLFSNEYVARRLKLAKSYQPPKPGQ